MRHTKTDQNQRTWWQQTLTIVCYTAGMFSTVLSLTSLGEYVQHPEGYPTETLIAATVGAVALWSGNRISKR